MALKLRNSCDACQNAKLKCSQEKPSCERCIRNSWTCIYSPLRRTGRPRKHSNHLQVKDAAGVLEHARRSNVVQIDGENVIANQGTRYSTFLPPASLPPSGSNEPVITSANSNDNISATKIHDHSSHAEQDHTYLRGMTSCDSMDPVYAISDSMTNSNILASDDPNFDIEDFTMDDGSNILFTASISLEDFAEPLLPSPLMDSLPSTSISSPLSTEVPSNPLELDWTLFHGATALPNTCNNNCYMQLNQQLTYLNNSLSGQTNMAIDSILSFERDMHVLGNNILNCPACLRNPSTLVLFSAVAEQVIRMLERAFIGVTSLTRESSSSSLSGYSRSSRLTKDSEQPLSCFVQRGCPLTVGTYELDEETKTKFVKQLLKYRMGRLVAMLKDVRRALNAQQKDINANVAEEMFKDIGQRLEILRGMAELL